MRLVIQYKDEGRLLDAAVDVDKVCVEEVLPRNINIESVRKFSVYGETATMFKTAFAVSEKEYK